MAATVIIDCDGAVPGDDLVARVRELVAEDLFGDIDSDEVVVALKNCQIP